MSEYFALGLRLCAPPGAAEFLKKEKKERKKGRKEGRKERKEGRKRKCRFQFSSFLPL